MVNRQEIAHYGGGRKSAAIRSEKKNSSVYRGNFWRTCDAIIYRKQG